MLFISTNMIFIHVLTHFELDHLYSVCVLGQNSIELLFIFYVPPDDVFSNCT